jgi:hypothetical protein
MNSILINFSRVSTSGAKIDVLEAKARQARAEARITYLDEVRELKRRQQAAKQKIQELTQAGDAALDDLKAGIEQAWKDLGHVIERAAEHF